MTSHTTINGSGTTMSPQVLDTMNGRPSAGSPVSGSSESASASAGTGPSPTNGKDLQNTFLTLLVTQMKNQDPTNPMDSSQMTSQLAQINTVTGVSQLNTSLTSLATQLNAGQSAQAAHLIGQKVLAPGDSVAVSHGAADKIGVKLANAVSDLQVTIKDTTGKIVRTLDLGAQKAGTIPVTWDGKEVGGSTAPDGKYTLMATGTINGQQATATTLSEGKVTSVVQQSDGTTGLTLSNGSTIGLSNLSQIL